MIMKRNIIVKLVKGLRLDNDRLQKYNSTEEQNESCEKIY
jgi:hypothetical protein